MRTAVPDRIEKQILLRAPVARVWQALTDATEFGAWFGVKLDGPFKAGARVTGRITPTTADAEVAKAQEPHGASHSRSRSSGSSPSGCFRFAGIRTRLSRASITPARR